MLVDEAIILEYLFEPEQNVIWRSVNSHATSTGDNGNI